MPPTFKAPGPELVGARPKSANPPENGYSQRMRTLKTGDEIPAETAPLMDDGVRGARRMGGGRNRASNLGPDD